MKKWLVTLALLVLAMAVPSLAEEAGIETNELLGVWKADEIEDLTVLIVPGSYAPVDGNTRKPDLYVEGTWQEGADRQVDYSYMLNRWKASDNSFLNSLLGNSMANAIQSSGTLGNPAENEEHINAFEYAHGFIGVNVCLEAGEYEYINFTGEATGTFYGFRDTDGSVVLYWLDNYDPHIAGVDLHRVTVDVPSAEEVTQGVLRPVIDMAGGAEAQAAIDVLRWTVKHQCVRMDSAALTQALQTAYAALSPEDAQAFRDHYPKVSALLLEGMGINPKTRKDPNRLKPFSDANLLEAIESLNQATENERGVDLLNAAFTGILE